MIRVFLTHNPDALRNTYCDEAIEDLGTFADVRINDTGQVLTTELMLERSKGCTAIIIDRNTPADASFFARAHGLLSIHRCAVDHRNINIKAASEAGILVTHASPGFIDSVVELSIGLMIDLAREITVYAEKYRRDFDPAARMGIQLSSASIGIVGYGGIGERLAEVALSLGMKVLVYDPYRTVTDARVTQCSLSTLLKQSQFVHCLATATPETENLMDQNAFSLMQKGSYFINVSRGNLVDEVALERALKSGHLGGAALDVGRANDQKPSPHLARMNNVIATPHIGGQTPEAIAAQALETARQVRAVSTGALPHNAINPEQAFRFTKYR